MKHTASVKFQSVIKGNAINTFTIAHFDKTEFGIFVHISKKTFSGGGYQKVAEVMIEPGMYDTLKQVLEKEIKYE